LAGRLKWSWQPVTSGPYQGGAQGAGLGGCPPAGPAWSRRERIAGLGFRPSVVIAVADAQAPLVPTPHVAAPMHATVPPLVAESTGMSAAVEARVTALQATHEAELATRCGKPNDDDEHSL